MKEIHLICNAHLDPIWQWEWEEGAAAALSTFRSAVDLAEEFDYIFCHNEVTLYKYIEEYAPALFARIKKLVREGKWHIMGGWYLQPDCNMPAGESFVRQIMVGHRYFMEKFGVKPTTAINFDAFGHSAGLPQIVSKCGQDSYMLTRTGDGPVPARQFVWEGVDGSRIKVFASNHGYSSPLGHAAEAIRSRVSMADDDTVCVLWGVGNHGGGPSRKDLADIDAMKAELGDDMTILHSTPEQFFAKIDPAVIHKGALRLVMPGCYTSMVQIKQKHAELENMLYMTEKLCSVAARAGLIEYPEAELDAATEDLLNAEFHDVLPGSSIRAGETNGLYLLDHGLLTLNRLRARAYFALSSAQPRAKDGEFPILVFNPLPYEWNTEIICELMLADQNWSEDNVSRLRVYDENGAEIETQIIKEESNLNLDWRKRMIFKSSLKPLAVTRFSLYVDYEPKKEKPVLAKGQDLIFDCDIPAECGKTVHKHVEINGKTGLLRNFSLDGKELISDIAYLDRIGACLPVMYDDNPDPWGMGAFQRTGMGRNPVPFALYETDEGGVISDGPFVGMSPIGVTEDGCVHTTVECFMKCANTKARIVYTIYKTNPHVDVNVDIFLQDADKMVKLALPLAVTGDVIGQSAFGTEVLYANGRENVAQRFVGVRDGESDKTTALFNRGTYASSYENGVLSMSLVRGVSYCAHPIGERQIIPTDKFVKKIDMGERNFAFRLTYAAEKSLDRLALEFNVPPYACNVFPAEDGMAGSEARQKALAPAPILSDDNITLVTMKHMAGTADTYILRLHNNYKEGNNVTLTVGDTMLALDFKPYEVKTVVLKGGELSENPMLLI